MRGKRINSDIAHIIFFLCFGGVWDVLDDPNLNKAGAPTELPDDVPQARF
jgi:hypothetical protein